MRKLYVYLIGEIESGTLERRIRNASVRRY